ncbi:5,10-methylenetetrahydrofolate reductase [Algivirga pacifica]|uniref:Methylenetetrahydrofolate reductase n=1 Tax=Algivirga pacifica TaxID=1162670 RepID=A0ABP9D7P2_9BACT
MTKLKEKIIQKTGNILLYGLTPPKKTNTPERIQEIAQRQLQQVEDLPLDGIILYDIQDEADRTDEKRPFPFMESVDPRVYADEYLKDSTLPKVVYRCVGKYTPDDFHTILSDRKGLDTFNVFVGAASQNQIVNIKLPEAYTMRKKVNPEVILGGVAIPERHLSKHNEHLRIVEKMEQGCSYFVSQAVYNVGASKDFLSDYYYHCKKNNISLAPIIFTFAPCGSEKTLNFMKWLGVNIPKWLENDLLHSENILEESVAFCIRNAKLLHNYAREKGIPIGFNVESVSIRKAEIEASLELVKEFDKILNS